jgi:hypothetical protein
MSNRQTPSKNTVKANGSTSIFLHIKSTAKHLIYIHTLFTSSPSVALKYKHSAKENTRSNHTHEAERDFNTSSGTSASALVGALSSLTVGGAARLARASGSSRLAGLTSKVGTGARETLTGTGAAAHECLSLLGQSRQTSSLDLPLVRLLGALGSRAVLLEVAATAGVLGLLVGGLEALEVVVGSDLAVAADLDNSVAVGLDGVFVCETARVDTGHVGRVESGNLTPLAGVGDAAKLGEEKRLAVVLVGLDLLVPARCLEGRGVAPGVVVEGEEVGALVIGTAVKVESLGLNVLSNVSSRVSDRDSAALAVANVLLHVTGDSLDIGRRIGVVALVDDLVTREKEEQVVVVRESVNGGKDVLEVDVVVRAVESLSILTVERVLGGVCVESNVDTRVVEHLHALVVVLGIVNGVDTDGVDTEILEVGDIALQALEIEERVLRISSTT